MATLHNTLGQQNSTPSENDKKIAAYIEKNLVDYYDEAISGDDNFQVFYNLSELRTGLVSWYDFAPDSKVLEIGAGFGALTGRLCQLCGHVTATERSTYRAEAMTKRYAKLDNLDIYVGDIADLCQNSLADKKFDYIVLVGLLERIGKGTAEKSVYSTYLQSLKALLSKKGKLLLAVENRFGLRYFCGTVEPHTNKAFDGIGGYRYGCTGRSFAKQELTDILNQAGFPKHKFYYPLPDYKLPQLIYTDTYLPEKNLRERLIPYYRRNDTLVARESLLYDDMVDNGVFPFVANSFFVECSVDGIFCDVKYAAISTDRGVERSFATTIHEGDVVYKKALYPEGSRNTECLYANICDLEEHGIPVVAHKLIKDGELELPYISFPTLSNYIKEIIGKNQAEFEKILDRLYAYILQSSETVDEDENEFAKRWSDEISEKDIAWGPILSKAYMELIPLNCFYDKAGDAFYYFDQEFVRENYPAGYVMFRAIHYIYAFTPNAEAYYPKQRVIDRYRLGSAWGIYEKEEQQFLDEVRNHKRYSQFYKWTKVDDKRITENAKRLESEAEKIAGYAVSDCMKKIWKVELGMLDEVDRICKKYGLTYFLVHGSLLGAVRHKGFIPWDDDLDIAMLRKDYDKFMEAAKAELPEGLSLHTPKTEKDVFWGGYARIRDARTTGIEMRDLNHKANLGIWIDILPIDTVTADEKNFYKQQLQIRHCHRLLMAKTYGRDYKRYADMKPWLWRGYRFMAAGLSHKWLAEHLYQAMTRYNNEASDEVAMLSGYFKHCRLLKKDFESIQLLEFEGRKVPVPVGYESYLFRSMGRDYLKYPPEEERKPKHNGIFDADEPYEKYVKLLCDTFKDCYGKQIILFGAGMMFEDYMKKYGGKYRPAFLVDNDESKWGRRRMGIEIKKPEAILEVPQNRRKLIICSFYYDQIEKQLQAMGVTDYQIYVQKLEWVLKTEKNRRE